MGRLSGKVAIITGAARGQGAAEARLFAAEDAKVVITDISADGAAIAQELGANALFVRHDVASEADWNAVVASAVARFGQVDILVNNAAIYEPRPTHETNPALFDRHYRVNQLGAFLGMLAVLDVMSQAKSGSIINVSSGAGLRGAAGMFAYATTKWAVRGMTKCAAMDLAPRGIRVNAILPGLIDTPMLNANDPEALRGFIAAIPFGRLGATLEVAELAVFLACDAASYITGAEITVDGALCA